jgi:hypothetical protein
MGIPAKAREVFAQRNRAPLSTKLLRWAAAMAAVGGVVYYLLGSDARDAQEEASTHPVVVNITKSISIAENAGELAGTGAELELGKFVVGCNVYSAPRAVDGLRNNRVDPAVGEQLVVENFGRVGELNNDDGTDRADGHNSYFSLLPEDDGSLTARSAPSTEAVAAEVVWFDCEPNSFRPTGSDLSTDLSGELGFDSDGMIHVGGSEFEPLNSSIESQGITCSAVDLFVQYGLGEVSSGDGCPTEPQVTQPTEQEERGPRRRSETEIEVEIEVEEPGIPSPERPEPREPRFRDRAAEVDVEQFLRDALESIQELLRSDDMGEPSSLGGGIEEGGDSSGGESEALTSMRVQQGAALAAGSIILASTQLDYDNEAGWQRRVVDGGASAWEVTRDAWNYTRSLREGAANTARNVVEGTINVTRQAGERAYEYGDVCINGVDPNVPSRSCRSRSIGSFEAPGRWTLDNRVMDTSIKLAERCKGSSTCSEIAPHLTVTPVNTALEGALWLYEYVLNR